MKRELALFFFIFILVSGLASAEYVCSNGEYEEDFASIEVGKTKNLNTLLIGLADASASGSSVDLIFDAEAVTLANDTIEEVDVAGKNYDVSLIELENGVATIKIEKDEEEVEAGNLYSVDKLKVFVLKADGAYPGVAEIKLMLGTEHLFLYYDEPAVMKEINGTKYLLGFEPSSEEEALITLKKCKDWGVFVEIEGEFIYGDNSTDENITTNDIIDEDVGNDSDSTVGEVSGGPEGQSYWIYIVIGVGVVGVVLFFFRKKLFK